jgi:hypothetical protein
MFLILGATLGVPNLAKRARQRIRDRIDDVPPAMKK